MPINKFTTLLDLARQAKILTGETATFDGKIQVGLPFSAYTTGVDTGSTVSLGIVSSETAVFSGDNITTIFDVSNPSSPNYSPIYSGYTAFTWTNPLFSATTSGLTLPITVLDTGTQVLGPYWTLTQTGTTGDYNIGLQYTGYSITYSFNNVSFETTATTLYSGFTTATQENFSAGTLDYKGPLDYISSKEDATVDGRLTTNKIKITDGASAGSIGYILTQSNAEGEGMWQSFSAATNNFVTGGTLVNADLILGLNDGSTASPIDLSPLSGGTFTGNTSGSCITDLYITNLYGCSPITIHDSIQHNGSTASGTLSNAFGFETSATTFYSFSEGFESVASGFASHAEGVRSTASGNYSHAEGGLISSYNTASGEGSHAEGAGTFAIGIVSHAQNAATTAATNYSHSQGFFTLSSGDTSHSQGKYTTSIGEASHAEGSGTTSSGIASHSEGYGTTASGDNSHAEGQSTTASGNDSHAEGQSTTASGTGSHAEGQSTTASGTGSHAEGNGSVASGNNSHAEGQSTTASNESSHAEGKNTTASGEFSHAEGFETTASANYNHAEGYQTLSSGLASSHAEGYQTSATTSYAHSEGILTLASGFGSHSEGSGTTASGNYSHSQGVNTIASGNYSHSEGFNTIASGDNSHAGGSGTIASGRTTFTHFTVTGSTYGAFSDYSAILGGVNNNIDSFSNNSVIIGGVNNIIPDSIPNTTIIGGNGITASQSDTVYVPNLNINSLNSSGSFTNLGLDSNKNLITGVTAFNLVTDETDRDTTYPSPSDNFQVYNLRTDFIETYKSDFGLWLSNGMFVGIENTSVQDVDIRHIVYLTSSGETINGNEYPVVDYASSSSERNVTGGVIVEIGDVISGTSNFVSVAHFGKYYIDYSVAVTIGDNVYSTTNTTGLAIAGNFANAGTIGKAIENSGSNPSFTGSVLVQLTQVR